MKKVLGLVLALLLIPSMTFGQSACLSSGRIVDTATTAIAASKLCGVLIETNETDDVTVTIHDNAAAAAGTVLFKMIVEGADWHGGAVFPIPVAVVNGLYVSLSAANTGEAVIVYYQP